MKPVAVKDIFLPFFGKDGKPLPKKLSRLFSHGKKSFCSLYREQAVKCGLSLSKSLEEYLGNLNKPIPKAQFPDALRAIGASLGQVFCGPKRILFDISYGCNLDCLYCRRHSPINPSPDLEDKRKTVDFLPLETIVSVLEDAKDMMVEEILLVGGGEPLTHPDFAEIVRAVKQRGFKLSFSTNGMLLTPELSKLLVELEVDNITVSVTGVSYETYRSIHPSVSEKRFHLLMERLSILEHYRRAKILKDDLEFAKPFTIFLHVLTSSNCHEVMDMALCGAELGFDTIWYKLVHPSDWSRHLCLSKSQVEQVKSDIQALRQVEQDLNIVISDYMDEEIGNLDEKGEWSGYFHSGKSCYVGWNFSYVDLTGDFSFCCGDKIVGRSEDYQSFKDFWYSKEYESARFCARNFHFGGQNFPCYNGVQLLDNFCSSCDNTNFNEEMESLLKGYNLKPEICG
jgi:MoaA/NifB/PqqE/SkfB family radical SAM enzyme